ncbi:MAG: HU family DNA-binding protein [Candidatus Berkelbacteria bacterium]|nr:HU family DNA-binding protein [Candidatus Berkelbacteria bacterium]
MSRSFTNKDQIAKKVSPLVDLSIKKTNEVLEEFEELLAKNLKTRKRVIIGDFGSFYLITMKSHTIKSIGTKAPRLLVEQSQIKFRPAKELRFKLMRGKAETVLPDKTAPKKSPFVFKPLSIMARVEKDKIKKKILERMLEIARLETQASSKKLDAILPTQIRLKENGEGRILGTIIKHVIINDIDNIHFSLGQGEIVDIFHSRPREKITSLPTSVVKNFLKTYLELEAYDIPQQRDVQIHLGDCGRPINIKAYSLPTEGGVSLYFKIARGKI